MDIADPTAAATQPEPGTSRPDRVVGYAYPWDVIGDPAFPTRVATLALEFAARIAERPGKPEFVTPPRR